MARWNKDKKVLEHKHSKFWVYRLQDLPEPNLQREVFPYEQISRIDFDHKLISIDPADEFLITDTTFRDGQQARPPYTVQQIEVIFDLLHRLSGPNGVIRQSEFFLYSNRDRESVFGSADGTQRDWNPHLGLRLPYFLQTQQFPCQDNGKISCYCPGRPGQRHYSALPF